jgi:uncharacterized membrane protein
MKAFGIAGTAVFLIALVIVLVAVRRGAAPAERFPWSWTLPAAVVIALTAGIGIARYRGLPARIPVHFDLHGNADRTAPATVLNAFFPVAVQVLLTAILLACAALALRGPRGGGRTGRLTARSLLLLAACLDLSNFFIATQIWQAGSSMSAGAVVGAATAAGIGLLSVVGTVVYVARKPPAGPEQVDADGHWRGFFYADRRNPALFVPKRFGIGWTLNFGRPASWIFLALILAVVILAPILSAIMS